MAGPRELLTNGPGRDRDFMSEIGLVQGVIKEVDKISKSNASFYCFYQNFFFFRSDSLTHLTH